MLRSWKAVVVLVLFGLVAASIALPWIVRRRLDASRMECLNHFRQLGQFAAIYGEAGPERTRPDVPQAVPPGTIANPALPPDQRLSWVASMLPFLDRSEDPLSKKLDVSMAWNAGPNGALGRSKLGVVLCPGALPAFADGEPMPTQIVGLTGVGIGSANWVANAGGVPPPFAGCFRYDSATSLELIRSGDGLSHTALFAETSRELGPWIRGGPATLRWLNEGPTAPPTLGPGGQFGGNYPNLVGFGYADGKAEFRTIVINPETLRSFFTIRGETGTIPGE